MASGASRVLVHTESASDFHVRHALSVGVHGYVVPGTAAAELLQCVRAVAAGQRYLSADVAHRLAESLSYAALTPRESDVLAGLSGGQCNKLIARQLGISVTTVKAHVNAIMKKMSVESRTQAVSVAAQRGLVRISPARSHHSLMPSGAA
ncbi:MAG: response regulator transcription factor [Comamonadaceae bacterium]|nr:MAG: response regulator transcription factor [Comamonadaceae bacterium]